MVIKAYVGVQTALGPQDAIRFLRENETVIVYDQATGTLRIGDTGITESVIRKVC